MSRFFAVTLGTALIMSNNVSAVAQPLIYQGEAGAGKGKHIVFLAGDHEYRSEEAMPALARIMARHHGFKCTVLFTVDKETGDIVPGCNNMPGTEVLDSADLVVMGLRFQDFTDKQMKPIDDYFNRGGPIVGLRTSTHAFKIPKGKTYSKYSYNYNEESYQGGFGRQVLGETWVSHYGTNHQMSTRLIPVDAMKSHPILRGVTQPWVQSGGYWADPMPNSQVLAMTQPLQTMEQDAPPATDKKPCPNCWTRTYKSASGNEGRVFTSTSGASEDLLNDDYRRLLVNACLWSVGLEDKIKPDLEIGFVGPYNPVTFSFGGYRKEVKPLDMAGWDTPIMSTDREFGKRSKQKKN